MAITTYGYIYENTYEGTVPCTVPNDIPHVLLLVHLYNYLINEPIKFPNNIIYDITASCVAMVSSSMHYYIIRYVLSIHD